MSLPKPLYLVVVSPRKGLSTATVYGNVNVPQLPESGAAICAAMKTGDADMIGPLLHNRLQEAAMAICPAMVEVKESLATAQPAGHLMSGSGTSWLALVRNRTEARQLARQLRLERALKDSRIFLVRSCS